MSKQYQIKQVETNERGHKVTTTVSTDDVEVVKALIGSNNKSSSESKKSAALAKKAASNKTTKPGNKKGVVIDAEFKEVKSSKKSKPKEAKASAKKTVAKPKALPAPKPKVKESKPKKEAKKKSSEPKSSKPKTALKVYVYDIKELDIGLSIYAPNKEGADKVINYYCKRMGYHGKFNRVAKKSKDNKKLIATQKLTADNYYQVQIEALEKGIKKNQSKKLAKTLPGPTSKQELSPARQNMKVKLKCFELIKKEPKLQYLGSTNDKHKFGYYGELYEFSSLPEAVKAFLNYKVWYEAGEVKTKKLSGQPSIKPPKKHPATTIKKVDKIGNGNRYEFYNKKGERVVVDVHGITADPKDKNSNPNRWVKDGLIKKPIYNYLAVDTYVTDVEGNCYGKYNPTVTGGKINFNWMLETNYTNEKKLINEVYRLANL